MIDVKLQPVVRIGGLTCKHIARKNLEKNTNVSKVQRGIERGGMLSCPTCVWRSGEIEGSFSMKTMKKKFFSLIYKGF